MYATPEDMMKAQQDNGYRPSPLEEMEKTQACAAEEFSKRSRGIDFLRDHPEFNEFITLIRIGAIGILLLFTIGVKAQTPVTVKPSPAADALNRAAQDLATEQKAYDTILQQARSSMDASSKQLNDKLQELNKALVDQLKADKKYKDQLDKIDVVQKQMQGLNADASSKFNQSIAPIQNKIGTDKALIDGLIPVVRQENDLPATATFDATTQKWTTDKTVETKK